MRRATLRIDIIIVGGGISGLACAYALGRSGHKVRVLEKNSGPVKRALGVRIPPNMTKILIDWGLRDELAELPQSRKTSFHSLVTGELMGYVEWREDVIKETGADFLLCHYDDLYAMIYKLAMSVSVDVLYNSAVASVSVNDRTNIPHVTLADGRLLQTDLLIGADGAASTIREFVTGMRDDLKETGCSFYSIVLPLEVAAEDPELRYWTNKPEWPVWMGDGRNTIGYPLGKERGYCFHIYWPDHVVRNRTHVAEGGTAALAMKELDLDGAVECIQHALSKASGLIRTIHTERGHPEDWVHSSGRVVLVGDAAHPIVPCCMHNQSISVEDAAVLGGLLAHLHDPEQVPQLLDAFQELRKDRCQAVRAIENANLALVNLPPGAAQENRDAMRNSLKTTIELWDDSQLLEQYQTIGDIFGYDATLEADEWWVKWGMIGARNKGNNLHASDSLDLHFEVTKSRA